MTLQVIDIYGMQNRMLQRFLMLGLLISLCACTNTNDEFEDAWMGNCYIEDITHLPVGWPIPGAPGQIPANEYERNPLR